GAGPARAARRQALRVQLGGPLLQRPRLRGARARLHRPAGPREAPDGDHRRDGARQGLPQHRGPRRPLVRQLHPRRGRGPPRRPARRAARQPHLADAGGALMGAYGDPLVSLAEEPPELMVLTAENRAAIRDLPPRLGKRFVDVGVAEQTMIGAAAGLALRGRVPVVHALAAFLTMRAFEFIRTDVGIPGLPVILVGGVPGFLSRAKGPTHQASEDVAPMRGLPGMQVVCPADEDELVAALPEIIASRRPTYIRYFTGPSLARQPFDLGRAQVTGDGFDVALLTYG